MTGLSEPHKFIPKINLPSPLLATHHTHHSTYNQNTHISIGQASGPAIARIEKRGEYNKNLREIFIPNFFPSLSRREKKEGEKKVPHKYPIRERSVSHCVYIYLQPNRKPGIVLYI